VRIWGFLKLSLAADPAPRAGLCDRAQFGGPFGGSAAGAADAVVDEAGFRHLLGFVDVAQIDNDRGAQQFPDAAEIEAAELVPW